MSYLDRSMPGAGALVVASLFPAIVIIIELVTGFCAGAFFDPVPTIGHLALIAFVPIVNFLLWNGLRADRAAPAWLLAAGGASIAVAASYSLLFLPMLPFALVAIIFLGIGGSGVPDYRSSRWDLTFCQHVLAQPDAKR